MGIPYSLVNSVRGYKKSGVYTGFIGSKESIIVSRRFCTILDIRTMSETAGKVDT